MAESVDHHAKLIIGDLVLTVAKLSAENEDLREKLARLEPPKPMPEPVPPFTPPACS